MDTRIFILFLILHYTSGQCTDNGIYRNNDTVWTVDSCTSCRCSNNIISCNTTKCKDPLCDISKGESFIIPANQCCPVCSPTTHRHCTLDGEVIAHNTVWSWTNCTMCRCLDGAISCPRTICETPQCGFGQILKHLPGECCRKCVSVEASCEYEGRSYRDEETWSSSKCEQARCSKGEVIRSVVQCEPILCHVGETAAVVDGGCCPTCVARSCVHESREYSSGEIVQVDRCQRCVCFAGEVTCHREVCPELMCHQGQREVTRPGACCPECVPVQDHCDYHGTRYYHGDLWNITHCEVAVCNNGNVRSLPVQCTPVSCKWNEKLIHTSCCPECITIPPLCHHNGLEYRNEDEWRVNQCTSCACNKGNTQCYRTSCPLCPNNTVPVMVPGECCPDCQLVKCHSDCATCDAPGYAHCTSCTSSHLLQDGKCVRRCLHGFYQDGRLCKRCQPSCATCFGNTASACTSCRKGLLQDGMCVPQCNDGFYPHKSTCVACPSGCTQCTSGSECTRCADGTKIPQGGSCVAHCADGYFYTNRTCQTCPPTCATCDTHHSCATCPANKLLERGVCVDDCNDGFYQLSITRCGECHDSCATCTSSSASACTSCTRDTYLHTGQCFDRCPAGYYISHGQCRVCHSSCRTCVGSRADDCTVCASQDHVIEPTNHGEHGRCVEYCGESSYLDGMLCRACGDGCETCNGPHVCTSCSSDHHVLHVQRCIPRSQCTSLGLEVVGKICVNASAVAACMRAGQRWNNGDCSSSCPSGSLEMTTTPGIVCAQCSNGCARCDSVFQCMECQHGMFLSRVSHRCVASCEVGYYGADSGTCEGCPAPCLTCSKPHHSTNPVCTSCRDVSTVLQSGQCVAYCVQQHYSDAKLGSHGTPLCRECDFSCTRCTGPTPHHCLQCPPGHLLQNGTCVETCSPGFYNARSQCKSCHDPNCISCTDRRGCTLCGEPYTLFENKCVMSCPRGYYNAESSCTRCPRNCLECSGPDSCIQCDRTTYLMQRHDLLDTNNGRNTEELCVRHCGHGYYANKITRVCEVNRVAPVMEISGRLLVGLGSRAPMDMIHVHDDDTDLDHVNVDIMMLPANGWMEVNGHRLNVGDSIAYDTISNGGLWFVHDPALRRHGVVTFRASDRQLFSAQKTMEVAVVSRFPPQVTKIYTLVVSAGEFCKIGPKLSIQDNDNLNDVIIRIIDPPKYGHISKLPNYDTIINNFKVSDLRKDVVVYASLSNITSHDVTHDQFVVQISDGYFVSNRIVDVTILPRGGSDPVLATNVGTHVRKGGMTRITPQQLQTIAMGVKNKSKIVYVVNPSNSATNRSGELILMIPTLSDAPVNYRWVRDTEGHFRSPPITRFTQQDIDEGRVWYRDINQYRGNSQPLDFEVFNENRHPPVPIASSRFHVTRIRPNIASPRLARGLTSPPQMSANDGRITVLHSGFLHYTDEDTSDRNILYNITRSLPSSYGTIEHADHPYVPITVFSQSDVDSNKIMYRPPVGGVRSVMQREIPRYRNNHPGNSRLDFEFTVSDGLHTLPPVNFTIRLTSGATAPPTFINQYPTLDLMVGGVATVGLEQLAVNDPDTLPRDLIFTLVKLPRHGTVIRNDFGTQVREGDTFTYFDVQHNNLHYIHNGEGDSEADQLQVSVTDATHTITKVVQVSILHNEGPSLDAFCDLQLIVPESSEGVLSRENLAYVEQGSSELQIVYHIDTAPRLGLLRKGSEALVPGSTFTQEDVTRGRLRYVSSVDVESRSMTDMMEFHVTGSRGGRLGDQALTITITPGHEQPPVVSVGDELLVSGGQEALLTPGNIMATDVDTQKRDLIINILRKPRYGQLINTLTEERIIPHVGEEIWFTMQDILDGGIYYKPSKQRYLRTIHDYFNFRVTDGENISPTFRLNITIQRLENEQPWIETSVLLCQDGYAVLINSDTLHVNDPDTSSDLIILTMTSPLMHGKLVQSAVSLPHDVGTWDVTSTEGKKAMKGANMVELGVGSTFTYEDVLQRKICYETLEATEYDESFDRRKRDTMHFSVTDGASRKNGELIIEIDPMEMGSEEEDLQFMGSEIYVIHPDGEEVAGNAYQVEANEGISVEKGSVTTITRNELRITSSNHQMVTYVITRDPNVGQLQMRGGHGLTHLTAGGNNEFNQEDIDMGYLQYNHSVSQGGGEVFFMFDVMGGQVDLQFHIHINEDHSPPRIIVNNGVTIKEGGMKRITTRELSASDESGRLMYDVIKPPKLGRLQLSSDPGHSIDHFNQADLVAGVIQYVHTSDTERTEDEILFSLSDGTNSIVQTFHISVLPIDNSLPVLENNGIRVQEGVRKTITEFELKATDKDTNDNLITFRIVDPPQHGAVERTGSGRRYVPVTSFTMDDIYESRISYFHDGTNSISDGFSFVVMDGTNNRFKIREEENLVVTDQDQVFHIKILPVDDGTPRLITNLGLSHLEHRDNEAIGDITKHALLTEDIDTSADLITYHITSTPRHGRLESTLNPGHPIDSFTQADINSGLIRYVLVDRSSVTTRDSFMFNVRDSLPNVVTGNTFNIRWSVISFEATNYTVNEEAGSIDINVVRRGNLNQYAFVLCRTEHGSATSSSTSVGQEGQVDYVEHAGQVQFDEYESEKVCSIQLNDDQVYEGVESFNVELTMPTYALLGDITQTTVYITDELDKPTLQFVETQYTTEERDDIVHIPIKRTGDINKPVTLMCTTQSHTATGSSGGRVESGSDYITRGQGSVDSVVTFEPGVSTMTCDVRIVDDSLYEDSEEFTVHIQDPSRGSQIGKSNVATVTITGPNDSPSVFLTNRRFVFEENVGTVDIPVHRRGPDLSQPTDVWCSTKQNDPPSAKPGEDFVATSTKITFRNEETVKICSLTILDDQERPIVEGNETFFVHLNSVHKAQLTKPYEALVVLNDTLDDVPTMQFVESSVEIEESSRVVSVVVRRTGDTSSGSSVICFTRQNSAGIEEDFVERPHTEMSRIHFAPGQTTARCNVTIVDDEIFESNEQFRIKLASASGDQWYGARVGENDRILVTIVNNEDAPTIEFERAEYSIREPTSMEATRQLSVSVLRTGDASEISKVRCSTRDGSAKSGSDYEPKSRMLRFQPGQTKLTFKVNILPNSDTEWQEAFLIVLGPHEPVNAILGRTSQATITILDKDAAGSLVLPSTPVVVSLMHYDDVSAGLETPPSPGYPLVCVTPCDPKYPRYSDTQSLCEEAAINSSAIRFSWEVSMPSDEKGGTPPFETVTDSTPFTSVNTKVLDSIYFGRRFHVRCVAQAVDDITNTGGTPLRSNVATIATDSGLCHNPIVAGSERGFQAQSFIANLQYMGPSDKDHPNTIHISVKIPHQDGRLPIISTMPISNLRLLLSRSIDRQQHVCSNLMYGGSAVNQTTQVTVDVGTNLGFVSQTDFSKLSLGPGFDKPYQFDPNVRERKTIDLYKYLNLKSCIWQFDAYYHMNELIDFCNGQLDQDFQRRDVARSQVTVSVPLYVSYVYVTAPRGWGALDHHTDMEFSFQYSNVVFRAGIQTDGVLKGRVQILRLKLREDGRLDIQFKTHGLFRGLFVKSHRTLPGRTSQVVAPAGMSVEFELTNTWSENTFDSPFQLWRAVSTYSRKDYSGEYTVEVIPCTVSQTRKWRPTPPGVEVQCTAYSPITFKIPIMFQQTNRPVPVVYTLETSFQLCNNEKVFMMDPTESNQEMREYDYTGAFTKGQTIFGRVLWTPSQDLKSAYKLQLEKVYLCTGRDGYEPKFDPTGTVFDNGPQYGCIEPSKNLQHRFLILDRSSRDSEDRYFHDVPFDAYFAADKAEFASMSDIPGVDGFLIKVDSLYKVEAGHQWYIQVLFQIGPEHGLPRVRRSAMYNVGRHRRSSDRLQQAMLDAGWHDGKRNNGTDMVAIQLDRSHEGTGLSVGAIAALSVAMLVILVLVALCCCCVARRRRRKKGNDVEMKLRKIEESYKEYPSSKVNIAQTKNLLEVSTEKNKTSVSVSSVHSNACETPLVAKQNNVTKTRNCKQRKRNLSLQIVNNLRADGDDSGTEV